MPPALPDSLARLLSLLRPAFTAPSFDTFCWLVCGFVSRVGEHTITGVWQAARLAGVLHHSRAHDFFSRRRWCADRLGFALAEFVVGRFVVAGEPIAIAIDETLFARSGSKVFGAGWHFDSAAPLRARRRLRFGNSFVCLGILVVLPGTGGRTTCLPLLFRLWRPDEEGVPARTRVELAHELLGAFAARFGDRRIVLAADAYYANRSLRALPANVTAIVRLRANAALWSLPPARQPGRPGRPRVRGQRLGSVREIAAAPDQHWQLLGALEAITLDCLWYQVLLGRPVRVVIAREPGQHDRPVLAVLCTNPTLPADQILDRYRDRWAIEVAFAEAKGQFGVGEARNRVAPAVQRTVPFGFLCRALVLIWYALNGNPAADVARHRKHAPWYRHKRAPSFADMLVALRRELIRAEFRAESAATRSLPKTHRHNPTAPAISA